MLHTRHAIPLVLLSLGATCQDNTGTIPADWHVTSFTSNRVEASFGDDIVLNWAYSTDEEVVAQELCFKYLYFDGIQARCFDVDPDVRSFDFDYFKAFAVHLRADSLYQHTEAALQVRNRQDAFMRAHWQGSDPFNPRLGNPVVDFSQFVALHDDDGDHVIDGLKPLFPTSSDFFRMRTTNFQADSAGVYGGFQGPFFPWAVPFPNPYDDLPDYANVVVYGGAMAILGAEDRDTYKPEEGEGEGRFAVGDQLTFDSVFLQLSYHWADNGIRTATDIEVGNLDQALALGITSTPNGVGFFGEPHDMDIDLTIPEAPRTVGLVKGAEVTNFVTPYGGQAGTKTVTLHEVEWNMPLFVDENLGPNSMFELKPPTAEPTEYEVTP